MKTALEAETNDITLEIATDSHKTDMSVPSAKLRFLTFISLLSATFGVSCLGLSAMAAQVGIMMYVLLLILSAIINYYSYICFIELTKKYKISSFSQLSELIFGRAKFLVDFVFFICNTGIQISNMILLRRLVGNLLIELGFNNDFTVNMKNPVMFMVLMFLIFPLMVKKKLKDLFLINLFTLLAVLYITVFIVTVFIKGGTEIKVRTNSPLILYSIPQIPEAYAYIFYTFMCQNNFISIYNEYGLENSGSLKRILKAHLGLIFFAYTLIGLSGYFIFYQHPLIKTATIMSLFTSKNLYIFVANFLMAFTSLIAFVFTFNPCKVMIMYYINKITGRESQAEKEENVVGIDKLNAFTTVVLAFFVLLFCICFTKWDVGYIEILGMLADFICPFLFVIGPIGFYFTKSGDFRFLMVFVVACFLYFWSVSRHFKHLI